MIELTIFFAIVLALAAAAVKLYEWRPDVLYATWRRNVHSRSDP
jgi:hypothetical protein